LVASLASVRKLKYHLHRKHFVLSIFDSTYLKVYKIAFTEAKKKVNEKVSIMYFGSKVQKHGVEEK